MSRFLVTAAALAGLLFGVALLRGSEVGGEGLLIAGPTSGISNMDDPGWVAFDRGDVAGAELLWSREMDEAAARDDSQAVARLLYNLSYVEVARRDHASAIELLRRSMAQIEADLDARLLAEQRLASLLDQSGLYSEGEQVWQDRLARSLGDSPAEREKRAGVLLNLAAHYVNRRLFADAERTYALGLSTLKDAPGPSITHESLFEGLSLLYAEQRRLLEAAQMSARRLELIELSSGRGDRLADALDMHARLLDLAGLHLEADEARGTAWELRRN